ncbi:alpha/beta hydrolase [Demequina aurantiaca]|uniref:alpha/beta hydrolase n=1 Tax=Demequina aurantiaca TaxID=676200 RepID=UPI000782D4C0|nr:alpha/beta hydrolase [Demequina aurantiaca]
MADTSDHRSIDPDQGGNAFTARTAPARTWLTWTGRTVSVAAVAVVLWACLTAWGAIVHGHPAYAILLGLTVMGAAWALWRSFAARTRASGWRLVLRIVLLVVAVAWVGAMWWLRPFTAQEPALSALESDATVTVSESATQIVLTPNAVPRSTGVFFQPGALVEARAYAAILRPLAESGYTVVIPKQPLGIAFLALPAFDSARPRYPDIDRWVLGGHSLGGVVAAIEADDNDADGAESDGAPAVGLMFFASYPAGNISESLTASVESISGTEDGLSTPAKIDASRANLPADSTFTQIEGASHSQFADYGPQPGDGTPTISHDEARTRISDEALRFLASLEPGQN